MADMSQGGGQVEGQEGSGPAIWVCGVCFGVVVLYKIHLVIIHLVIMRLARSDDHTDDEWATQTATDKASYEEACPRLRFSGDGECVICMGSLCEDEEAPAPKSMDQETEPLPHRRLGCGHVFHAKCIDAWLKDSRRRCPMCREHPRGPFKVDGTQTPTWDSPDWDEEAACEAPWPSSRSMDTE